MCSLGIHPAKTTMDFSGKRVLVTGGGRGIGLGIVKKFLQLGAHVVVLDKNDKLLGSLKDKHGERVTTVQVDLSNWNNAKAAVKDVLPLDHLVNNVGIIRMTPLHTISENDVDLLFNVNFKAALAVSQIFAADLIERGKRGGTIVNISSVADAGRGGGGTTIEENYNLYGCTKAATTIMTKYLASELLPSGIRVNCIRPGAVNTELVQGLPAEFIESFVKPKVANSLDQELIEPEDIGNAVAFLSSPMSSRMTGSVVTVDSGFDL